MFKAPNQYRIRNNGSPLDNTDENGNKGAFIIPFESYELKVIASDGGGWEHVSESLHNCTPNWREMCFIKDLFWDDEDCVVQYHLPISEYVNNFHASPVAAGWARVPAPAEPLCRLQVE